APIPVQLAEEQVPLLFAAAEDVFGGVEPVVDEGRAAVAFGVIARKKDRVRGEWRVWLPVAVQRLHEGHAFRSLLQGKVRVQDVDAIGYEFVEIEAGLRQPAGHRLP